MIIRGKWIGLLALSFVLALIAAQCGLPPVPEYVTIVETVIIDRVVETVEIVVTEEVRIETIVEITAAPTPLIYQGQEINLAVPNDLQIVKPLREHATAFETSTGIIINLNPISNDDLHQTILDDLENGANSFDAFVFSSQWMIDFAEPGYLEDLTDRVAVDGALDWPDVAPVFRDLNATYNGNVYAVPLSGDFLTVYYRTDVLEEAGLEPPATWDDYLTIAETVHEQDFNGDFSPDYGSCIGKAPNEQGHWFITAIAGAFLQSQGPAQGVFFDHETFDPQVNNSGFIRALEIYQDTSQYGPPDELELGVTETRRLFARGRCALTLDWGALFVLGTAPGRGVVRGKIGAVVLPGSTQIVDAETGELVSCTEETCPHAVDGVNHAPFIASGGWSGAINAAADDATKDAVFDFLSYVSQPAQSNTDVASDGTGFNPYRISQLLNRRPWVDEGMTSKIATDYLSIVADNLNHPNIILDLRIPQHQRYQQEALNAILNDYLTTELSAEETAQAIFDRWQTITDEIGRDNQQAIYRASLGVQ